MPDKNLIDQYLTPTKYKVSEEALIRYGNSRYSVDPKLIGEEVTADLLDNKLYIYYKGKLVTLHSLNKNPINYNKEHYTALMEGKVAKTDMASVVTDNLEMMDRLLEVRKVKVSEIAATKSADALIAYLNQSPCGHWLIGQYAHFSPSERLTFIKGMNQVLPYVANREQFISRIKFSLKDNLCKTLDFDCWVNDFMAVSKDETILSEEGYEILKKKYAKEIDDLIEAFTKQHEEEQREHEEYIKQHPDAKTLEEVMLSFEELPFR